MREIIKFISERIGEIKYEEEYKTFKIFVVKKIFSFPTMFGGNEVQTWYNGYIVIPQGSKYYGMDYYNIDKEIDIHGGFTFSEFIENEYVIGFDTNHIWDDENTQNIDFVLNELRDAVDQIENGEKNEL